MGLFLAVLCLTGTKPIEKCNEPVVQVSFISPPSYYPFKHLWHSYTSLGEPDPFPRQEKLPKSSQGEPRLVEATEAIGPLPFQSKGFGWFASRFDLPEKFHQNHPEEQQVSFQTSQVGIGKPPTPSLMYDWEAMLCWLGMWGSKIGKASRFERMHIDALMVVSPSLPYVFLLRYFRNNIMSVCFGVCRSRPHSGVHCTSSSRCNGDTGIPRG